eukprot:TRINITY_DN2454_c0_g2_i1.p1 TRINITY_DN2454_c0_g2~~TRINITY_DN2454_c0_g2_i1.p1  ORF type:complete len:246 (+),score=17.80 TRINITY_DN2454_c0_g2_i1:75-812(+)
MVGTGIPHHPWHMMDDKEKETLVSFMVALVASWSVAFLFLRFLLFRRLSYDFSNRCVSVLHVLVSLSLASRAIDWTDPLQGFGSANTENQALTMVVSLAYFIYDFFGCLFATPVDYASCLHHVFTVLGLAYGIIGSKSGAELVGCLWLMEISNPFMHGRELLRELKLKETAMATVNDLLFVLTFTAARIVIGPFFLYRALCAPSFICVKIGAIAIQLVSILWFAKICKVLVYKVKGKRPEKPKRA